MPDWQLHIGKFLFPRDIFKHCIKLLLINWVDWVPWNGTWIGNKYTYIYTLFNASYKCVWILLSILLSFYSFFCGLDKHTGCNSQVLLVKKVTSCDRLTMAGHQVLTKSIPPLLSWGGERKYDQRLLGHSCLTTVFITGFRVISALAPGAYSAPLSSLIWASARLFLSHVLTPFSGC